MTGPTRLGLGCMALTGLYGYITAERATATIHRALDLGVRLFDTAPLYGEGMNETLVGQALAGQDDVFISTKFGLVAGKGGQLLRDSSPSSIRLSVENSLRRLRRERIDLLLQHRNDSRTPDGDVVSIIADLVREGKVDAFGLCSANVVRVAQLSLDNPVRVIQNEFSFLSLPHADATPTAFSKMGVTYMAHSPLARGKLTTVAQKTIANPDDYRSTLEFFRADRRGVDSFVRASIGRVAAKLGSKPGVVGLAWLLARGPSIVAIPGARSPYQVDGMLEASDLSLPVADLEMLDKLSARFSIDSVNSDKSE